MDVSKAPYQHAAPWDTPFEPVTLPDLFARAAERRPDAPLVDFLGRIYSYRALYGEARRFAAGLQELGIARGDRVGLFLPNVPIYVSAYYGAMMAGAVVVNFSPLYTVEELNQQVEDSGARILVTIDAASLLPTALEVLDRSPLETLVVGRLGAMLTPLKRIALKLLGRKSIAAIPARTDVREWSGMLPKGEPAPVALSPADLALLQYTGGTTGRPKGAMLTHANLAVNAMQVDAIDPFDRDEPDVIMGALPLFHVFANTCVLNRTVAKGACIAMVPRFDAKQVLQTIERTRVTAFPGVPTMFQALLDHPRIGRTDFSSLKVSISGGAPLPAPVREKFEAASGARLVEGYGLTESAGVVSTNPYTGLRKPGTIGQVIPQTRVMLLDKEDPTRPAPDGEPGELVIAGPQIMQGYWNRPDAATNAFADLGGTRWLRTGDVAEIDEDGFITIVDRIKDMIAVGGFKVFPSQVEAVLLEHAAVKEALVIGVPDAYRGEMPQAYVTLAEGAEATAAELQTWLNARVGKHERVSGVVIREELPKTMIGKLDRKALRAEVLVDA
ncbi:long-chain-fatty-acid--CoA ligase [Pelagerythrobacter aerophilus]|uniref:Long-chain fatty acid--CoA ligase n=1 Tax=Pelagerythrobacter aerophilus TaxID=2306995 RepID=A0A418NLF7_9SPHN|nr:long-chain fatty acid--CoA ligase [Pelagerythrobacter aerophilus]RIV76020.1 long-chain fatty acid--CoA ligase [Pelagerythrobacter aerophilus]RIV80724.1 long-chain fatty acid--CoA ligase [Pelagerythrobacter aerophilus]